MCTDACRKKNHVYNDACNYIAVDYQQIVYGNIANQIHGFTIDYDKYILITIRIEEQKDLN